MANKADQFYFDNFVEAANCSCEAANYLVACLKNYDYAEIERMVAELHAIEHRGDKKKHEMSAALAKAFVTPVDREDLALISQNIDEVTDAIEEILQRFYIYEIKRVFPLAIEFAEKVVKACDTMRQMLAEFINFKKPAQLRELIIELNHTEEEGDKLYLAATLGIRKQTDDVLEIISWRKIYDRMEACIDAAEHVGDCVETVVMKNT